MISEGTRQLDLYDFFSILIPGVAFVLGLFPFLPDGLSITSTFTIIPLLVWGFIIGRTLQAVSLLLDDYVPGETHRNRFNRELRNPSIVSVNTVSTFYEKCNNMFSDVDFPTHRSELCIDEKSANSLYSLVRGYVHMDARGRSRTFQAIFDFYRNMIVASTLLLPAYIIYSIYNIYSLNLIILEYEFKGYQTYLADLGISPSLILIGSTVILTTIASTYFIVRKKYSEIYVQYLITDFILLVSAQEENREKPTK